MSKCRMYYLRSKLVVCCRTFAERGRSFSEYAVDIRSRNAISPVSYHTKATNSVIHVSANHFSKYQGYIQRLSWSQRRNLSDASSDKKNKHVEPGSSAFVECESQAIKDLFFHFAHNTRTGGFDGRDYYINFQGVKELLLNIGDCPDEDTLKKLYHEIDCNNDGKIQLDEFLLASDKMLGDSPARIIIVVGGPCSGKGILCGRLESECNVVHVSSGDLLQDEVNRNTLLGKEVEGIMKRGELISSSLITTLIRRRTRNYPGRRVILDGFPRSVENARGFEKLMGKPELCVHLECDDTVLMERIMKRSRKGKEDGNERSDDDFDTAIQRVRTFRKYHKPIMDWLRESHVPIVNLDSSGTPENVWNQLLAIGRLMRPITRK